MIKNPLFTMVLGLMGGLALGYVFAESQAVLPAKSPPGKITRQQIPKVHPPLNAASPNTPKQLVSRRAAELQGLLAKSPKDVGLMVALANLYFDASQWEEARNWYEQILAIESGDANVMTDLAVAYRNLKQPGRALKILDQVVAADPAHWQALYNRLVVLHFDLNRNDDAVVALLTLEKLAVKNSQIPDMRSLANEVRGG